MFEKILGEIALQPEIVPNWLVVVLGVGIVFVGLLAIVIICKLVSYFVNAFQKKEEFVEDAPVAAAPAPASVAVIENKQEIVAAVCAAIAEELGTDVSALRIHSFKKI